MRRRKSKTALATVILMASLCTVGFFHSKYTGSVLAKETNRQVDVDEREKMVSQFVWQMMERHHLSNQEVDDEISRRAFESYFKSLDPAKLYFRQTDLDEFSHWETKIDDLLKSGDTSFAYQVFDRFAQRVEEQTKVAIELVETEHDFSIEEEIVIKPEFVRYANSDAEARDILRKQIKYNLLTLRGANDGNGNVDPNQLSELSPKEILRKRFQSINRRIREMDREDVMERYLTSITNSFDPHTNYMSGKSVENFMIQMNLELDGIGATLQGSEQGYTVIKSLVTGGAAARQGGLKLEDKIVAVAQGDDRGGDADQNLVRKHGTEFVDAAGMRVDDVVSMVRGEAGTVVRLSVLSKGTPGLHTVRLVREKIKLEDQAAKGVVLDGRESADGTNIRIGVLELPLFYAGMNEDGTQGRSTTADVARILEDFNRQGVEALVLDLRGNGGGSLKEAIDCTGLFIDSGPIVQVKDSYGRLDVLNDTNRGVAWTKPMIVLTSKFSASASEILAGAIQDYQRGLIVGDSTTHGKGTVQTMMDIGQMVSGMSSNDLGALKITIQQFYRPDGASTQLRGVLSDIVLPSVTDKMNVQESDLDYPVEYDHVRRVDHGRYAMVSPQLIQRLGEQSTSRQNSSVDFQNQHSAISRYVENKDLKSLSLNEEKFLARRNQRKAETDAEKAAIEQMTADEIKLDFYLDEVLSIASDYVDSLSQRPATTRLTAAGQR